MTSGSYGISTGGATVVALAGSANVVGIGNNGTPVPAGGLDGNGDACSATLLGSSLGWSGNTYAFGGADVADAVSNTTVPLPAGNYSAISLLGTAVHGNQANQVFTVNYADGTSVSFTQSVSDWYTPQGYAGESAVLAMPYRLTGSGAADARTFSVYGYSFALNPAKTVTSLTLPKTRNVVVLAIDLTAAVAPPPAAAPSFKPAPGTYGTAQSVTLTSSTSGASIYYTTDGSAPTPSSSLYTAPIVVGSSTTLKAIATANGYSASPVASGTYVINTGSAIAVSLTSSANVDGIANNGAPVPNGGLDGSSDAYSATLLGSALSWGGNTYLFGGADVADAASNTTIPLPAGNYTTLSLLATAVRGNLTSQAFTVNYSDGTSATFTQSLSDWYTPQNYPGESRALTMAYRITPTGALDNRTFYLYGYAFALNPAKTVASLTLPKTRNVIVLAADLH
ncbi:MAG TPA: chitobiase/beta-hexosaminidase C-terminal domain-containing protein [Steroidobacteraceae bacterium]|nr:chitobiase/beta-hexosaminidase C-terminal domain-containing protein [Steroidobacteraceae bacterium]